MTKVKEKSNNNYFHFYNANPKNNLTDDCVIRALAVCLDKSWEDICWDIVKIAIDKKLVLNSPECYQDYLKSFGFKANKQLRKSDNKKYTGKDFCEYLNKYKINKLPVFANIGTEHVVCFKYDNDVNSYRIYDTWDSTDKCVGKYWDR